MSEPTTPQTPQSDQEKRNEAARDLIRAYKRCFSSEDGRRVLADLDKKYGWGNDPFEPGIGHADLANRCGMHSPLRYIHKMKEKELPAIPKAQKQIKAKSGLSPQI